MTRCSFESSATNQAHYLRLENTEVGIKPINGLHMFHFVNTRLEVGMQILKKDPSSLDSLNWARLSRSLAKKLTRFVSQMKAQKG